MNSGWKKRLWIAARNISFQYIRTLYCNQIGHGNIYSRTTRKVEHTLDERDRVVTYMKEKESFIGARNVLNRTADNSKNILTKI